MPSEYTDEIENSSYTWRAFSMGRKSTISYETKVSAIEAYENNVGSISMIAKMFNVKETSLKRWIANYQSQGIEGLITKHKHTQRTKEFKTLSNIFKTK